MKDLGHVYLVGAGPGDPELLTIKAVRALEKADVIVYDRLVSAEILDMAPAGVTRINVGKQPHSHPVPQEEINLLLARLAEAGRVVVRLKGGDPLTFGRGSGKHSNWRDVACLLRSFRGLPRRKDVRRHRRCR